MDTDFEDKCQEIASKRRERKASVTKYLPAYIHTPGNYYHLTYVSLNATFTNCNALGDDASGLGKENETEENMEVEKATTKEEIPADNTSNNNNTSCNRISPTRKRKLTNWQRGYVNKKKRKKPNGTAHTQNV